MQYFTYNGKSSASLLSIPLMICFFDFPSEFGGFARETVKGEATLSRSVPNQYGSRYSDAPKLEFDILKEDFSCFSPEEQRLVNRWLTSPKLPKWLEFTDSQGAPSLYRGTFTDLRWKPSHGAAGVSCEFECDSPYSWNHVTEYLPTAGTYKVFVDSDELDEFVYPTLTVQTETTSDIEIINITDKGQSMKIHTYAKLPVTFDCRLCIPSDATSHGIISYEDLGWNDAGDIYWLRLLPGENQIKVNGNADVILSYLCPQKKAGGFLC